MERTDERVVVGGAANLTTADFSKGLREVLESLEEQVVLMRLLGESGDHPSLTAGHLPSGQSMGSNIEALAILCELAINVNLALFFFNLLPLPPLDGSRILRHYLPYNMLNAYDRMGILSFVLMIFLGGPIVRFLMRPTLGLVQLALRSL